MQILTTGKNIDIGDALRGHIEQRLADGVAKYFDGAVRAHVTVDKQRQDFSCECVLHLPTGLTLTSRGNAADAYVSFDVAADHLETRLRRYKRRLKKHHINRATPINQVAAASYVIDAASPDEDEGSELNPTIIAEDSAGISELSVGEAVMQLDISSLPFVLFRNARHGALNVVYRRDDGHIGWIDPNETGRQIK